jgi:aspartate aminotransferase-like enzyme
LTPIFVPGPVDVAPEVLAAQARPMIPHQSKDFEALFQRTEEKLRRAFYTSNRIFQITAAGAALQEAAVRNFVERDVLVCTNGAEGERWQGIAASNGKQVDGLELGWGEVITPERLGGALQRRSYEAVCIVHNDASTGVENPIRELAETTREVSPDTLVLVDATTSLGGTRIEMDAWGIDFLLTTSDACLAMPPGLAFAAASERAMRKADAVSNRGWYIDFMLLERNRLRNTTPSVPAISLMYALEAQMDRILAEGLENRYARHTAMAETIQNWAETQGMPPLAPAGQRSKTVTCLQNTRAFPVEELNKYLALRGMSIANGAGELRERYFRIAHMGEIQMNDCKALMAAIEEFIR